MLQVVEEILVALQPLINQLIQGMVLTEFVQVQEELEAVDQELLLLDTNFKINMYLLVFKINI